VTQDKCPTIIKYFLNDPFSFIWLIFCSQLKVVCDTFTKIEGDKISACEVAEELEVLCEKIRNRKNQNFFTSKILNSHLNDLKKQRMYDEKSFKQNTDMFYDTFLSYFEKWGFHFDDLKILR